MRMKVGILTGASRGIGVPIARHLASRVEQLVIAARDEAGLAATASLVEAAGARAIPVVVDVSLAADRERLVATASALGPIDLLVNNAGIEVAAAVVDQRADDIERQVAVNLLAPIHLTRAVLPAMIARRAGCVVMVSSMSGKSPTPYNAIYTATKHGLNGFTASLRIELADTGVHAGVVCPSFVADAGMWSDSGVKAPWLMSEVSLQAVVDGVERVIGGAGEVLVTPTPVRPLLALGQLFPGLDGPMLRRLGVLDALRDRARVITERRGPG
jgi:short-subunit dehydrogenase